MHRIAALLLVSALSVSACGSQQAAAFPDLSVAVQYWFDLGGQNVSIGNGRMASGLGGWTPDYACADASDQTRVAALRFDDSQVPDWDLARDGGTPPPLTRGGAGVVLRVEPDGKGAFAVSLGLGGRTYTGTAPSDGPAVGFHHVSYATPPEMLAVEALKLTAGDGSSLTLTGTASFPMECTGM